jgi:drug/metabolite transporter (DMT)-like permease
MSHRQGVALMVLVTLLWSMAGIVSRQLEAAKGFEVTFWRSAFNALALVVILCLWRGRRALVNRLRTGGPSLWVSGLCWGLMFTAFMMALTLTTVANVLVPMAIAPLVAALMARVVLGTRVSRRTAVAILAAGIGIAIMAGPEVQGASGTQLLGMACALAVPLAGALNWVLIQSHAQQSSDELGMLPAVLIGAALSAAAMAVPAAPFQATPADVGWLALLGVFQLAVPCLLAVQVARVLPSPEMALLSLLEVVFGVAWAWLGTAERPTLHVAAGGLLVLLALVWNEAGRWRSPQNQSTDTA